MVVSVDEEEGKAGIANDDNDVEEEEEEEESTEPKGFWCDML